MAKARVSEQPTPEQFSKGMYAEEPTSPLAGAPKRHRRLDTSELDRLYYSQALDQEEHGVLSAFQRDLANAGMIWSVKSSAEPSSGGGNASRMADNAFMRAKRVSEQMKALDARLGPSGRSMVLAMLTADLKVSPGLYGVYKQAAEALSSIYA